MSTTSRFDRWYLTHRGSNLGPLSTTQLLDLLATNQVAPEEFVWPEGVDVGITVQRFLERVHAETLPGWMESPSSGTAAEGWYYMPQQERRGPFAAESLVELAASGQLRPDDALWRHDASGWTAFKARTVIPFPPPGSPWPSWVKEVARIEGLTLPAPRPAAQVPTWLDDVKQTELQAGPRARSSPGTPPAPPPGELPPHPAASALPDWMEDVQSQKGLPTSSSAKPAKSSPPPPAPLPAPPAAPVSATPDWVADIRQIEESLRRRLVQALANPAQTPAASAPPLPVPEPAKPVTVKPAAPAVPAPPAKKKSRRVSASIVQPPPAPAAPAPRLAASAQESATPWPLSQDYNEAIQNPAQCFTDPELRQGVAVANALGLPIPCSGNFADVYAVETPSGKLAVKCFTHRIPGLQERYVEISKHLEQAQVRFMVDFEFLEQGIRVRDSWYPVLKMQWVEGVPLNTYVRDQLDSQETLQTLCRMWVKLAARLRKANLAHGDLQHGNVLLMPGTRAGIFRLRLVDYDGMCVPALDLLKPIEVGHPSYQHPQRQREGTYGLEIDRFSHLVIYTALRSLVVGGRGLWDRFDNGDNMLFTKKDFDDPPGSPLFQELRQLSDPGVKGLVEALATACGGPLQETPLLEDLPGLVKTPAGAEDSSYTILSAADDGTGK